MEKAICLLEMCREIWRHQIALKCIKGYMDTRREDAPIVTRHFKPFKPFAIFHAGKWLFSCVESEP